MADLTPERLAELRRIAEAAVPGKWSGQDFQLAMTPRTALALLDRIEELEAENERLRQIEAAARTLVDTAFEVTGPDEYVYQAVRIDYFYMLAALLKGEGGASDV